MGQRMGEIEEHLILQPEREEAKSENGEMGCNKEYFDANTRSHRHVSN